MTKVLIWAIVIVLAAVLIWKLIPTKGTDPTPVTETFIISDHPGNPAKCVIQNTEGGSEVVVHPGDYVKFRNDTALDRKIEFGTTRKLFEVDEITIPASGGVDSLRVRDDADADGRGKPHTFESCHDPVGPPAIIVCPPGRTC